VGDFDLRFPHGPPSMVEADNLTVRGDWTFGAGVRVVGDALVGEDGSPGKIPDSRVLGQR
ncbi:MAG: UTP--glucose-1-phosphate uridylyltransferase, partial [Nocardioidaceae bacterium]